MSDLLPVSPYLCQSVDRSYRDFLDEQIAHLAAGPQCRDDQLAMLREERQRIADRDCHTCAEWRYLGKSKL
jgi:hypothetical protein